MDECYFYETRVYLNGKWLYPQTSLESEEEVLYWMELPEPPEETKGEEE
jgi:hypothetical protein